MQGPLDRILPWKNWHVFSQGDPEGIFTFGSQETLEVVPSVWLTPIKATGEQHGDSPGTISEEDQQVLHVWKLHKGKVNDCVAGTW